MTKLICTGRSTATAYHFRVPDSLGWAICTVNEATGELNITSDWGDFAYRWHVGNFGAYRTLTAFIAEGDVDYLARKLCPSDRSQVFSAEKSVAVLRRTLCARRLRDGRRSNGAIDKYLARRLWEELGDLVACGTDNEFFEQLEDIGFADVFNFTAEDREFDQTPADKALREIILPALIEACRVEVLVAAVLAGLVAVAS